LESFAIPPGFQMFSLGILSVNEFLWAIPSSN
jgi:hypothetical protein